MQENRSFEHSFGTLRGVRGFGDRHPLERRDYDHAGYDWTTYPERLETAGAVGVGKFS